MPSPRHAAAAFSRRDVLRGALAGSGLLVASSWLGGCSWLDLRPPLARAARGGLGEPDANGVRLPRGFTSRVVARSGEPPAPGCSYLWHASPDGAACVPTPDGGWVYISNSELTSGQGGVGALRFSADGEVIDAYPILQGTSLNCSGGLTPSGTWLSCEEFPQGRVWECDPLGRVPAAVRPALGTFVHECIATDLDTGQLYLTEDAPDGRLYRFTPAARAANGGVDLSNGVLEVAEVVGAPEGPVRWHRLPDPSGATMPTARQVPHSTRFAGSEGMAWHDRMLYFVTKFDNRVWAYDTVAQSIRVIYDDDRYTDPVLTGVDTVIVAPGGEVLVAEDGGDMQLVAINAAGDVYPVLQVVSHIGSEIAGPAFDPSGTRLYFSSQRGPVGLVSGGITFEIRAA